MILNHSEDLEKYFGAADFSVFFALLISSALIGIYFGCKDKNKKSVETYYYGDRRVSPFAVAMSMAVSYVSAITVIGYPVEVYFHGIMLLWVVVGSSIGAALSVVYFIPFIFRLQMKSIYEFLELRYSPFIRRLFSGLFILRMVFYMAVAVYLPALALNSVTPLDLNWSIALTSLVCTFYTTLGGIKAVVWTDVLQGFIMLFGSLALLIKATMDMGEIGLVTERAHQGGRFNLFDFQSDIRISWSVTGYFFSYLIMGTDTSCFSQVYAQRYLSCKSVSQARRAAILRLIPEALLVLLAAATGLVMYTYYYGCDPYEAGLVSKKDQLVPRFAVEVFRALPGLAGLFVAAAFSASLSTVSSGINALAAIIIQDLMYPFVPSSRRYRESSVAKIVTVILGCLVTCIAYLVSQLQSTIVQISLSLTGIFIGPMSAVYFLGATCPWINKKGALAGLLVGCAVPVWCCIGRAVYGVAPAFVESLLLNTDQCFVNASSSTIGAVDVMSAVAQTDHSLPYRSLLADTLYAVSPYLYDIIAFQVASISMLIVSGITGFNKPNLMKPELFVPLLDNKKIFPSRVVKFFRFGVPEEAQPDETVPLDDFKENNP